MFSNDGYNKMVTSVTSQLDKLKEAAANKQNDIINSLNNQSVNESTIMEANQNEVVQNNKAVGNSKEDSSKINSSSMITQCVRDYCGSVMTIMEKKYLDYVKVLNKLKPVNNTSNNKQPDTPEENKEDTNQENK